MIKTDFFTQPNRARLITATPAFILCAAAFVGIEYCNKSIIVFSAIGVASLSALFLLAIWRATRLCSFSGENQNEVMRYKQQFPDFDLKFRVGILEGIFYSAALTNLALEFISINSFKLSPSALKTLINIALMSLAVLTSVCVWLYAKHLRHKAAPPAVEMVVYVN